MTQGRMEQEWIHTSHLLAIQLNCHRDSKKHPRQIQPHDVNPYYQHIKRRKHPEPKADISILKAFLKGH